MKRSLLAMPLLAALPFAAIAADGLSYSYVEGGYIATDVDGPDADGWNVGGSGAISDNFHIFGSYSQQEIDDRRIGLEGIDFDQWHLGLGYNHPIATNTDLLARIAYDNYDLEGFDSDGYSAEVGVRSALTRNFEGYALAGYQDADRVDGDFYGRLGALVKFSPNWGATADVKFSDGDTQWFVGPRYTF